MITSQPDIEVREVEDYIAKPKPNGYKSLHLIVEVPVYLSDRVQQVPIELQIRTIAMDFWASLEHKIYYKFNREVPPELLAELTEAAETAHRLDMKMERLNEEFAKLKAQEGVADEAPRSNCRRSCSTHCRCACPNDAARPLLIVVSRLQVSGPTCDHSDDGRYSIAAVPCSPVASARSAATVVRATDPVGTACPKTSRRPRVPTPPYTTIPITTAAGWCCASSRWPSSPSCSTAPS